MKATTLIVLGGLLFAGTSLAAEPQQVQNTDNNLTADSGMKVGIDPKTGKLRRLTAAESANLDVLTAKNRKAAAAMAKGGRRQGRRNHRNRQRPLHHPSARV